MSQKLTVDQSFQKLLTNLNPTEFQRQRIQKTRNSIDSVLANDHRIFLNTQQQQSFLTGSYNRNTIIRPIDDIDLYVRVHYGEHAKNQSPRSILLLIRSALLKRYPNNTKVNIDSPCVVVKFSGYKFEIVPVVGHEDDPELYSIPAPGSREWMQCYPNVPSKWFSSSNHVNNKMFIPIIKILKQWNRHNNVKLKSFHIELLTEKVFGTITEIISYPQGIFDWMYCVRNWVWENDYPFITEPGKSYVYADDYLYENERRLRVVRKKLDTGLKKAERAWNFHIKGRNAPAKRIWHSLLGEMFPSPEPPPVKPVLIPPKTEPVPVLKDIFSTQIPTDLLSGYQRDALLGKLANPFLKPSGNLISNSARNALLGSISNPQQKPFNPPLSDITGIALRDLFTKYLSFRKIKLDIIEEL